ncbi:tyrosine-type recombinase/integrase, partial [Streptomyces sp. N35]|uniref:tyrosine-type recombinase/integrase n=1 Tax=Streptomyces sp. N35 TaxID=2795730 RepID=UPI0018F32A33
RLEDAKIWLANAQTDSRRGEFFDPRDGEILLIDYIEMHWWPARTDPVSTRNSLRSRVWTHIVPLIGHMSLNQCRSASTLRMFRADLLGQVGPTTALTVWNHLSSIFSAAVDDKRLPKHPFREHKTIKPPKPAEKKAQAWTQETVAKVREGVQDRYQLAVDLGLGLGLRQGEVFGLAEEDFDFENQMLHIRRQLQWAGKDPYFCLPKGGKVRSVPFSAQFAERVRAALKRFPAVECTLPWANPEPPATDLERQQRKPRTVRLVVTTTHGNRVNGRTWNQYTWKPALAAAGMLETVGERRVTTGGRTRVYPKYEVRREDMFHVLRHTFASVQLEAGESVVTVSKWLGHAKPAITLEHYAHFMPGAGLRGLAAMDAWFTDSKVEHPSSNPPEIPQGAEQAAA